VGKLLDSYVIARSDQEIQKAILVHDRIDDVKHIYSFALKGNIYTFFTYTTDDTIDQQALVQVT
jgi:microcompartment protein CcmL/EutN